jgi:hypothetical protein
LARARSEHPHGTGIGPKEAEEERDGGGFSRSVGPEESHRLAPADVEAQMVESDPVPIAAYDVVETQSRLTIDRLATEGGATDIRTSG